MQVTVRYSGPFRAIVGRYRDSLLLPDGITLRDLLAALRDLLPASFADLVLTPVLTGAAPLTLLLLNSANLRAPADLDRPLAEGDVVAFVPPMEGG